MAEIRRDPITGRWIIASTDNPMGPEDFPVEEHRVPSTPCPFCPGNERMTPPEVAARRTNGGQANGPGWTLRVVPNKFPALRIEGNLNRLGQGLYDMMNGVGAHEVIIETPDHQKNLADFETVEMVPVLELYQERCRDLQKDKRFRYLLIFKNFGESAGASLSHPHTQLIALPIVPKRVLEELRRADLYFSQKERCVFCDMIHQELSEGERVILETSQMVCFAPFASRFPFELWILPKNHSADFTQIGPESLRDLAEILKQVLHRVQTVLHNPSYNFILHTSPLEATPHEGYHWHLEIMPRLTRVAGFEWGSGFYICPTPPELAASFLRGEKK
ncbi:MAG: galactose-1-phosphate uridylyltransferase [Candidatus Omnitrophica bacterium]|nr:galactose-1-phosphate uridylyltransferase [Candidatus Omnitrophota bacterium]